MPKLDQAFNPYEPPRAAIDSPPSVRSRIARPLWVWLALCGPRLPGLSARRSAFVGLGVTVVVGLIALGLGLVFAQTPPGIGFDLGVLGIYELGAMVWIHRAIRWVDRHDAW